MSTVTDWNETTSDDESDDTAPPSLPHEESVAEIGDDATMDFASGSVVFSISGVRFKIPKALLQQHSEVFSAMLDMKSEPDEQVIALTDSLNAFRQFRAVLFTPLESCLFSDREDSAHTDDLLDLLALSHKYCASAIEARALEKLVALGTAEKVAYLDVDVRLRILEIATLVGSDQLARPSRASLLRSMSSGSTSTLDLVEILTFGKQAHDKEIIGAAYYAIMCSGRGWWTSHYGVDDLEQRRLTEGMMRCAKKWHDIQIDWAMTGFGCHLKCAQKRDVLDAALRVQGERDVEWYDVVGKIDATLWANSSAKNNMVCAVQVATTIEDVLDTVKSELYDYFMDET